VCFSGPMADAADGQPVPEDGVRDWPANIGMTLFTSTTALVDPVVAGVMLIEEPTSRRTEASTGAIASRRWARSRGRRVAHEIPR
jgi:hypothetical protein